MGAFMIMLRHLMRVFQIQMELWDQILSSLGLTDWEFEFRQLWFLLGSRKEQVCSSVLNKIYYGYLGSHILK